MAKETKFNLENKLSTIKTLMGSLQNGEGDFDKNIETYEKAMALIDECKKYLETKVGTFKILDKNE